MNARRAAIVRGPVLRLLTLTAAVLLATGWAAAQKPESTKGELSKSGKAADKPEVHIIRLRFTIAADLAKTLDQAFGGPIKGEVRIVADESTNSLIVVSLPGKLAEIQQIVKTLDQEEVARPENRPQVKVFELGTIEPDATLKEALTLVVGRREAKVAVDPGRKLVVASGDVEFLTEVEKLLVRLQEAKPERTAGELQVRVVWLVGELKGEDLVKPPEDLKPVVAELAKLGIKDPTLAAQCVINATPSQVFEMSGSAKLPSPCRLTVNGIVTEKKDGAVLNVEIDAAPHGLTTGGRICSLKTVVTAPLGHFVVLGVAPTEGWTSVFVVQITRLKPVK